MAAYKEIVTKAVIGKGKKNLINNYKITPENSPNTVLGCWVINHNFEGSKNDDSVLVRGDFDVNVWYSYDNDTKTNVTTQTFSYEDKMKVALKEESQLTDQSDIIVRSLKQPTVKDVKIENGLIDLQLEKELGVEIVGDTKVKILTEDDMDDYDIIEDEIEEQPEVIAEEIETQVDENYM